MKSRPGPAEAGGSGRDVPAHAGVVTLPKLTALRLFAALWVVGFHALPRSAPVDAWAAFWNLGWLGVTFFFVLSGFILTYTYGRGAAALDLRRFWFARFARVYPLYVVALAFAVPMLVHDVRHPIDPDHVVDAARLTGVVVSTVTMLQSWFTSYVCVWNCPGWSLSDEAFFYALFPLAVLFVATRNGRAALLALTGAGMLLVAWAASAMPASMLVRGLTDASFNPLLRLPEFLLGVWLGGVYLARRPSLRVAPIVAAGAAAAIVVFACRSGLAPVPIPAQLIAAPLFAILIFAVAASNAPATGLLARAPIVLLGEASYALYILHGPLHGYVLAAFNRVAPAMPPAGQFAVYMVVAVSLAVATFILVERPVRTRLRAWYARAA
jgi:peptidoglycan/LPS O-acetylase OafA/YrhL